MQQFRNFLEMIRLIQDRLEEWQAPEPDTGIRNWEEVAIPDNDDFAGASREGLKQPGYSPAGGASFLLRIQFRQNTSWQGKLQWLEQKKTVSFRSALEMSMLFIEALEKSIPGHVYKLRSWDEKDEVS